MCVVFVFSVVDLASLTKLPLQPTPANLPPLLRTLLGGGEMFEVSSPAAALTFYTDLLRFGRLSPAALAAACDALGARAAAALAPYKAALTLATARVLNLCTDEECTRVGSLLARLASLALCAPHAQLERTHAALQAAAEDITQEGPEDGALAQLPPHVAALAVLCRAAHLLQVRKPLTITTHTHAHTRRHSCEPHTRTHAHTYAIEPATPIVW